MRTISVHGAVSGGRTSDWLEAMGSRLRRFGAAWEERRRLAQDDTSYRRQNCVTWA
jgi:hypothetical protein